MKSHESVRSNKILITLLFFGLATVEGLAAIYGLSILPKSETESALFAGYSLLRLSILAVTTLATLASSAIFFFFLLNRNKASATLLTINSWYQRHDFTTSAMVTILFVWFFTGLILDILLNPAFFPRAILYQYLYERIRPVFLWTVAASLQTVLLVLALGGFKIEGFFSQNPITRGRKAAITAISVALSGVIILWLNYASDPLAFSDGSLQVNIGLVLILILLLGAIFLFNQTERSAFITPSKSEETESPSVNASTGWLNTAVFAGLFLVLIAMYGMSSYFIPPLPDPNNLNRARLEQVIFGYGFNQLRWLSPEIVGVWLLFTGIVMVWINRNLEKASQLIDKITTSFYSSRWHIILTSLVFAGITTIFRTNYINEDTKTVMGWLPNYARHGLIHVRFDQMFESNLHFEAYKLFNRLWGWSVESTYSAMSCLAGFFFMYVLLVFCRKLAGRKALLISVFIISGGYIQLFFGDMENYTLTAVLILTFFYCALLYIKNELSLPVPAFVLVTAMMFHMESAYLLPSLFFLTILEIHRRRYLTALVAWLVVVIVFSLTLLYFIHNGASFQTLLDTSWGLGRGGSVLYNINLPDLMNLSSRLNMMALVFPLIFFLLPVILLGGFKPDFMSGFLMVASAIGLLFPFFWISTNGYFCDLTMFSLPIFAAIILLADLLFKTRHFLLKSEIWVGLVMTSLLFSYTWIIHNHYIN